MRHLFLISCSLLLLAACVPVLPDQDRSASTSSASYSSSSSSLSSRLPALDESMRYRNARLGFSLVLPSRVSVGDTRCEPPLRDAFAPVVPFEDGDMVYLAPAYTVSRERCERLEITLASLKTQEEPRDWPANGWKMITSNVHDQQELLVFIREHYGDACALGKMTSSDQEGTLDVALQGVTNDADAEGSGCPLNFIYAVKYSPTLDKVVTWKIGQDGRFGTWEDGVFDYAMAKSFRFD